MKLTDEGLLVGLPREVADVAAAAVGGGGVTDGGPVAAALRGGGLGGRLVLADGDVAIAEGVTWSVTGGVGFKIDGSASCWAFGAKFPRRGRDRAPSWPARSSRDNSEGLGTAWLEKKAAGWAFARPRADTNSSFADAENAGARKSSRTVEGLDGDLSLVHVGVLDDAVAAGAALAAGGDVHEGDGAAAGEDAAELIDGGGPGDVADVEAVGGTLSHGARKTFNALCDLRRRRCVVPQEAIGPAKTLKTAQQKNRNFQAGEIFFGEREAENAPNLRMATRHSLV